jgi:inner membrane protein
MPSPVGHLLGGAAVYLAGTTSERRSRILLAITLVGSVAPDLDFLPGIVIGDMRAFHHGISHSVVFALLFGGLVLVVARFLTSENAPHVSLLATLAYTSHVLLDLVSVNEGTRGVPLLWPLSDEELGFPLQVFGHFRYGDITEGIWSVVRWVNVGPLLRELAVLGALVIVLSRKEQIGRILARTRFIRRSR